MVEFDPYFNEHGNWQDEDGIVHELFGNVDISTFVDADHREVTSGYRYWCTPCRITFDAENHGKPVYVTALVTCLGCLEHDGVS